MSSTEQILANRQNSLLSTGPTSESGKIASARNAISHGLSSTGDPVLPHEDRAQFNALLDRYKLDFSPSNGHEEFLVVIMVGARWRLERDGSFWYPSLRIFQQTTAGDWAPVVARVAAELAAMARR